MSRLQVFEHDDELVTSTLLIARLMEKQHYTIKRVVEKNLNFLAALGPTPIVERESSGRARANVYHLNQSQTLFIMGEIRGRKAAVARQTANAGFDRFKKLAAELYARKHSAEWQLEREAGKPKTLARCDAVADFVAYALAENPECSYAKNPSLAYVHLAGAIRAVLFETTKQARQSGYREFLDDAQLSVLADAEVVAQRTLRRGMASNLPYRAIRKSVRDDLSAWADLTGVCRTHVPPRQSQLAIGA